MAALPLKHLLNGVFGCWKNVEKSLQVRFFYIQILFGSGSVLFRVRACAGIVTVVVKKCRNLGLKIPPFKILRFKAFRGVGGGLCF